MRNLWCYEERPLEEAELAAKVKGWAKLSQGQKDAMMEPATLEVQAENCVKKVGQLMKQTARALDVLKKEAAKKQEFQQKRELKDAGRAAKEAEKAAERAKREAEKAAKRAEREARKPGPPSLSAARRKRAKNPERDRERAMERAERQQKAKDRLVKAGGSMYSAASKDKIKAELAQRGLKATGAATALMERLAEALEQEAATG